MSELSTFNHNTQDGPHHDRDHGCQDCLHQGHYLIFKKWCCYDGCISSLQKNESQAPFVCKKARSWQFSFKLILLPSNINEVFPPRQITVTPNSTRQSQVWSSSHPDFCVGSNWKFQTIFDSSPSLAHINMSWVPGSIKPTWLLRKAHLALRS